jgi:hypothetical protein
MAGAFRGLALSVPVALVMWVAFAIPDLVGAGIMAAGAGAGWFMDGGKEA